MKIGIFGGTFDPFTEAHKHIVDRVLDLGLVEKVLIVPTVVTYHRGEKVRWLSDKQRLDCIDRMLIRDKYASQFDERNRKIVVWKDEYELKAQCSKSEKLMDEFIANRRYVHTLMDIVAKENKKSWGSNEYYTIIGEDSYKAFPTWYDYKTILELSKLIVFTGRDGVEKFESDIPCRTIAIDEKFSCFSSTEIRKKYREIDDGFRKYLAEFDLKDKKDYGFSPEKAVNEIRGDWENFSSQVNSKKFILGISGGKDSTIVAHLAAAFFGKENVYGVTMPNGEQNDQADAEEVFKLTGINRLECNIGKAFEEMLDAVAFSGMKCEVSDDTKINLPPRLRMACLFALGQSIGATVINTDNLSERVLGYFTLFGDGAGSYAPIKNLTVTEVIAIGKYLGIPDRLILKKPGDGLQEQGDEERMGIQYSELDMAIRGIGTFEEGFLKKVEDRFNRNLFKTRMVHISGPSFNNLKNVYRDRYYDKEIW